MNIKTSRLTGSVLDWAVMKCEHQNNSVAFFNQLRALHPPHASFHYSTNWAQAGQIIEREKIKVAPNLGGTWHGQIRHTKDHPLSKHPILSGWTNQHGPTPLIAAMRAYVASKMGDAVEVPEEFA